MTTPSFGSAQDIPLLTTKLYIPPPRPNLVPRPRLIERLNADLHRNLTPMRSFGFIICPGRIWQDDGIHRSSFQFLGLPACPSLKTGPGPVPRFAEDTESGVRVGQLAMP